MALVRWRPRTERWPWSELPDIREEFSDLFGRMLAPFDYTERGFFGGEYVPSIDVLEEDDKILVRADLPGMEKKDIGLSIADNILTITGERKYEEHKEKKNYFRMERCYGNFVRRIELPTHVDAGKVSAQYKNGVLEVYLPKREEAKRKEIAVEVK